MALLPLPGSPLNDTLNGGLAGDRVLADLGDDLIDAGGGNDLVFAGGGNDTARGGRGADRILGEAGDDILRGDDGADTLFGGSGNDTLDGGYGGDLIYAGAGNDVIEGDPGDDTIYGGDGNDQIIASYSFDTGQNQVYGGTGNDFAYFSAGGNGSFDGGAGQDGIQIFWYNSAGAPDALTLDMRNLAPLAQMGTLTLSLVGVEYISITANDGDDTIYGGDDADQIGVLGGSNLVGAGGGNDLVSASLGFSQRLDGGLGVDRLILTGTSAAGAIRFDASRSTVSDGHGSTITGFEDFTVNGYAFHDQVTLGSGNDVALLGWGNDTASGGAGADELRGDLGSDQLLGDAGNDYLNGGRDNDALSGGDGNDVLVGGAGIDTLSGGAGADDFRYSSIGPFMDLIEDFTPGVDQLWFNLSMFAGQIFPHGTITDDDFAVGTPDRASGQFVLIDLPGSESKLVFDYDGTGEGGALDIVRLAGDPLLTASDIAVIAP